ncbi:hypothetical protein M3Y99_01798800 [Aphelenchoides fujianensis]|nr:hypothetical protein M3Y99_01798800 [Aphelenchoides fujianensis]
MARKADSELFCKIPVHKLVIVASAAGIVLNGGLTAGEWFLDGIKSLPIAAWSVVAYVSLLLGNRFLIRGFYWVYFVQPLVLLGKLAIGTLLALEAGIILRSPNDYLTVYHVELNGHHRALGFYNGESARDRLILAVAYVLVAAIETVLFFVAVFDYLWVQKRVEPQESEDVQLVSVHSAQSSDELPQSPPPYSFF